MERVVVSRKFCGLLYMQVCVVLDATDDEILSVCNRDNPAGTSGGWVTVIREGYQSPLDELENKGSQRLWPVLCEEEPNRQHILVGC